MIFDTNNYFEVYEGDTIHAFDTLEEAEAFADEIGVDFISEIGGAFDEYIKCEFCGEWELSTSFDTSDFCERCREAIWSRGE